MYKRRRRGGGIFTGLDSSRDGVFHAIREGQAWPQQDSLQGTIGNNQEIDAYYENLRQRGLEYGPAFRTIPELRAQGPESLGPIAFAGESDPLAERYIVHPTVLDGALQILGTALTGEGEGGAYLPVGSESLRLLKRIGGHQWATFSVEPRTKMKGALS